MARAVVGIRVSCVLALLLAVSADLPAQSAFTAHDDEVWVHRFEEPALRPTLAGGLLGDSLASNDTCGGVVCSEGRLRIVANTQPTHGLVRPVFALDGNGQPTSDVINLQYISRGGYIGDDTFAYTAHDTVTGATSTASVLVHVQWDGTEPQLPQPADDTIVLDPCTSNCEVLIYPLNNDQLLDQCVAADSPYLGCLPPSDEPHPSVIGTVNTTLTMGTVVVSPAEPNVVRYTPAPGFSGDDEFIYSILQNCVRSGETDIFCDDTGIDVSGRGAIIKVHVRGPNRAPTASDASYTTSANTPVAGTLGLRRSRR